MKQQQKKIKVNEQRRRRPRREKRQPGYLENGPDKGPATYSAITPINRFQRLYYTITKVFATGTNVSSVRFTPNAAYDVDPTLGSTSTPGFAEYASLYGFYRVKGFGVEAGFVSEETSKTCEVYTYISNQDPGTSMNYTVTANPLSKVRVLGINSSMSRATIKASAPMHVILGSNTVYTDEQYRALVTGVPADLTWLGLGVQTLGGGNFTNSVLVQVRIWMDIEFYDRLSNLTAASRAKRIIDIEESRLLFKKDQKLCPCTLPRFREPQFAEEQQVLFDRFHK